MTTITLAPKNSETKSADEPQDVVGSLIMCVKSYEPTTDAVASKPTTNALASRAFMYAMINSSWSVISLL